VRRGRFVAQAAERNECAVRVWLEVRHNGEQAITPYKAGRADRRDSLE
jgi:hypothetical protein